MNSYAKNKVKRINFQIYALKKVITRSLIWTIVILHITNIFALFFKHTSMDFLLKNFFIKMFQVSSEGKIPTWYSSFALLFCALILTIIIYLKRKYRAPYLYHWIGLAGLFTLMSLDEATCIHEMTTVPLRSALQTTGIFYFAWVIPGLAFVTIFGLTYLRFIANLPNRTKRLFLIAGFIYLSGVLGMELVGSAYSYMYKSNLIYSLIATIEEVLEMSGIVVFIYALLDYLEEFLRSNGIEFRVYEEKQNRHLSL